LRLIEVPSNQKRGETVSTRETQNTKFTGSERSQGTHDVLLVSSFGLWAAVLGLMPVFAFRLLAGS
jgi:hypothetical protein